MEKLISPEYIGQAFAAAVVVLTAIIMGILKLYKNWKEVKVETSIVQMMHEELERLSNQNKVLAIELNKFQVEIIKLSRELSNLSIENDRLNNELKNLTLEITRLQEALHNRSYNVRQA